MNGLSRNQLLFATTVIVVGIGVCCYWMNQNDNVVDQPNSSTKPNKIANASSKKSLPLHPVVTKIVNEGPKIPYLKFNYLIKELPLNLADHDIDALINFISGNRPQAFSETQWGSLVNDIEECLTVQTIPNEKVAKALIDIFRDESKIQLQRDYALQHIGGFAMYLVHTEGVTAVKSPLFKLLLSELKVAASQSSKPWSGTSINLLGGILRAADYKAVTIPDLDADTLTSLSMPIASDESAPLNARLPALQAATRRGSPAARELALKILESPDSGLMLVQSAAATLAQMGTSEDLAILRDASSRANRHTTTALKQAIRSIESKYTQN